MIVVVVGEAAVFGMAGFREPSGFAADDGFDAGSLAFGRTRWPRTYCHGRSWPRRLAERFDLLDERIDLIRAVEETELGMEMEMHELRWHERIFLWRILEGWRGEVKHANSRESNRVVHYSFPERATPSPWRGRGWANSEGAMSARRQTPVERCLLLRTAIWNVLVLYRVHGSAVDFGDRDGHAAVLLDRPLQKRDRFT